MKSKIHDGLTVTCWQCWHAFKLRKIYCDDIGYFAVCPKCKGSFDIDLDEETKNQLKEKITYV